MILSLLANAGYVLAVQLLALLTLDPADFGSFSLFYLAFALGSSLTLSVVSEAWSRREILQSSRASWAEYGSAALWVAIATAAVAAAVAVLVEPLRSIALIGAIAVLLATFRTGARYHDVRIGRAVGVTPGDLLGLLTTMIGGLLLLLHVLPGTLESVASVWALGSAASLAATRPFRLRAPGRWSAAHREQIRPLLRESLLLDAGAIGTPLVLAPMLGLAGFGIYRAVSNVAAPVRLLLNPLRPLLAARERAAVSGRRMVLLVLVGAVTFGAMAGLVLVVIESLRVDLGALSGVAPYAIPVGLFVAANFLGHYFYIVSRAHATGRELMSGRLVQTVTAVLFPVLGFVFGALTGAIWGYAVCTLLSALYWLRLATTARGEAAQ